MNKVVPLMPKRRPEADDLLSAAELAERWRVCVDTVYRIPESELPIVRVGPGKRLKRYRMGDVLAYEER